MYISELAARINQKLADDTKTQTELIGYMDAVIDDINSRLNSRFPTYTEFIRKYLYYNGPIPPENPHLHGHIPHTPDSLHQKVYTPTAMDLDYNLIPDKYQRSVVIVGAALKVYQADEEGNESAVMFQMDYEQQLFYMVRDFSFSVPDRFQEDDQGYVGLSDYDIQSPAMVAPTEVFSPLVDNGPFCINPPLKPGCDPRRPYPPTPTPTPDPRVDQLYATIKYDGDGTKYLADDGTYKTVASGAGEVTEAYVQQQVAAEAALRQTGDQSLATAIQNLADTIYASYEDIDGILEAILRGD